MRTILASFALLAPIVVGQGFTTVPIQGTHNIQTNLINIVPTGTFTPNNSLGSPFSISSAAGNCGPAGNAPCNYFDGFTGAGKSVTFTVSVPNATDVYTLMNTYFPPAGALIATVKFVAPNYTGLYQFNATVANAASGNAPVVFTLNGSNGTQTLYLAVQD